MMFSCHICGIRGVDLCLKNVPRKFFVCCGSPFLVKLQSLRDFVGCEFACLQGSEGPLFYLCLSENCIPNTCNGKPEFALRHVFSCYVTHEIRAVSPQRVPIY